ncbi:MAG: hypothetical protein JEZ12_02740 [Desulfobacterium sp.]|nr:hypothetical protein [Desulfobacterium sp.]
MKAISSVKFHLSLGPKHKDHAPAMPVIVNPDEILEARISRTKRVSQVHKQANRDESNVIGGIKILQFIHIRSILETVIPSTTLIFMAKPCTIIL